MADTLKERKIYRVLTNVGTKAWDKIAFWTTAKSVDAADGNNLETKVGAIKGITTSTSTTTKGYAVDATVIKTLNDSLKGFTPIVDSTGKITGYKTKAGADTVFPFSGSESYQLTVGNTTVSKKCTAYIVSFYSYSDENYGCRDYSSVKINDSVSAIKLKSQAVCIYGNSQYNHNYISLWSADVEKGDIISSSNSTIWVLS